MRKLRVEPVREFGKWAVVILLGGLVIGVGAQMSRMKSAEPVRSSPPPSASSGQWDVRPIGEFRLKPGEVSQWFDLPAGASYMGASIDPNSGYEKILTDRVNEGSDAVVENVSVMEGNALAGFGIGTRSRSKLRGWSRPGSPDRFVSILCVHGAFLAVP